MNTRNYYSQEETVIIKQYAGKITAAEIAIILGRSTQSVKSFASSNKISLKKIGENHHSKILSNLQREMILVLSNAGFTDSEINKAAFSHVSRGCIYAVTNSGQYS